MSDDKPVRGFSWGIDARVVRDEAGYYDPNDADSEPGQAAKRLFLERYRKATKNKVVADLAAIFRKHRPTIVSEDWPHTLRQHDVLWWQFLVPALHQESAQPELRALAVSLTDWATKYRLTMQGKPANWIMEVAMTGFERWQSRPRVRRWEVFLPVALSHARLSVLGRLVIGVPPWQAGESKDDFRRRSMAACKLATEEYLSACSKTKWTRRETPTIEKNIENLVARLMGQRLDDLLEGGAYESEQSRISHGVKRVSEQLGLDPPPRSSNATT